MQEMPPLAQRKTEMRFSTARKGAADRVLGGRRCAYKPRIVGQDAHDAGALRHELAEEVGEHGFKADGDSHFGILYVCEREEVNRLSMRKCLKLNEVWKSAGERHVFSEGHKMHLGIAAKFLARR